MPEGSVLENCRKKLTAKIAKFPQRPQRLAISLDTSVK